MQRTTPLPLYYAAPPDQIEEQVKAKLANPTLDISAPDPTDGSTLLHLAVASKKVELVQLVLERGAKIDVLDNIIGTPLHLAVRKSNINMVKLLLDKGADLNIRYKEKTAAESAPNQEIHDLIQSFTPGFYIKQENKVNTIRFPQKEGICWVVLKGDPTKDISDEDLTAENMYSEEEMYGNTYPSLINMNEWGGIPQIAVITSPNGVGKSQLLAYIYHTLQGQKNSTVFYMDSDFKFEGETGGKRFDNVPFYAGDKKYDEYARILKNSHSIETQADVCIRILNDLTKRLDSKPPYSEGEIAKKMREFGINFEEDEHTIKQNMLKAIEDITQSSSASYSKIESFLKKIEDKIYTSNGILLENAFAPVRTYKDQRFSELPGTDKNIMCFLESKVRTHLWWTTRRSIIEVEVDELKSIMKECVQEELNEIKLGDPTNFLSYVFYAYKNTKTHEAEASSTLPPLEQINKSLRENNVNYRVRLLEKTQYAEYGLVEFVKNNQAVSFSSLSTGEQTILSLLAWQFAIGAEREVDNKDKVKLIDNKVKLMLLDEPDKHLDPRFCKIFFKVVEYLSDKCGIQFIITTHRVDTIALVPDKADCQIFSISREKDKNSSMEPITKLRALFRLTQNMLPMTSLPINVYTENANDAFFYKAIYAQLREVSDQVRDNLKLEFIDSTTEKWVLKDEGKKEEQYRVITRRSKPHFLGKENTSGNTDKGDSGCTGVVKNIVTEMGHRSTKELAYLNIKGNQLSLLDPLGILDNDYGNGSNRVNENKLGERITVLKRHSLENYLFDPFVLFSILKPEDIELIKDEEFTPIYKSCHEIITSLIKNPTQEMHNDKKEAIDKYFDYLIKKIGEKLVSEDMNVGVQLTMVNSVLNLLVSENEKDEFNTLQVDLKETQNEKEKITLAKRFLRNIVGVDKHSKQFFSKQFISIILKDKQSVSYIMPNGHILNFDFPKFLLNFRGHDIEYAFKGSLCSLPNKRENQDEEDMGSGLFDESEPEQAPEKSLDRPKNLDTIIKERIQEGVEICIPIDLAETFIELSDRMREQVRKYKFLPVHPTTAADELLLREPILLAPVSANSAPDLPRTLPAYQRLALDQVSAAGVYSEPSAAVERRDSTPMSSSSAAAAAAAPQGE